MLRRAATTLVTRHCGLEDFCAWFRQVTKARAGKLYDDKGNRMSPSFSTKNGVRYRFYVSSALLRGRKAAAGSVARVAATEIESAVRTALETLQQNGRFDSPRFPIEQVERVVVTRNQLRIKIAVSTADGESTVDEIKVARSAKAKDTATVVEGNGGSEDARNKSLIQSVVRAHVWMDRLRSGAFESIEALAEANCLHPKVVRQALRLAFLSPDVTSAILEGGQPEDFSLARIPKTPSFALDRASALARLIFPWISMI